MSQRTSNTAKSEPIAVRALRTRDGTSSMWLELHAPLSAEADDEERHLVKGDWFCKFRIIRDERFNSAGIDGYFNDDIEGTGLPAYVPQFCGLDVERRLEKILADEVDAWAKATK